MNHNITYMYGIDVRGERKRERKRERERERERERRKNVQHIPPYYIHTSVSKCRSKVPRHNTQLVGAAPAIYYSLP